MNREKAKQVLPILQAYAEGKTVQLKTPDGEWTDLEEPNFVGFNKYYYRIKPEELIDKAKYEERIHTLEVYLEGAINYLILAGDTDNSIISDVEKILHKTFNRNFNTPNVFQKLTKAKKIIDNLYAVCKDNHYPNSSVIMKEAEQFLKD